MSKQTIANSSWNELNNFIKDNFQPFKPCYYYHKGLNWIVITLIDCSITNNYINPYLTIGYTNDTKSKNIASFIITNVNTLFDHVSDINNNTPLQLIEMILKPNMQSSIYQQFKQINQISTLQTFLNTKFSNLII